MSLIMYERIGYQGRRPSPFSWRIRYALAHKGITPEFRHVRFADVDTIRALSGQHFVPIVIDGAQSIGAPHLGAPAIATTLSIRPDGSSSGAYPRSIEMPRCRSSGRRSVSLPVSARTSHVLPWSM